MSLLNTSTGTDPLSIGINAAAQMINVQYAGLLTTYNSIAGFVWDNPIYTPQEVVAGFGANAAQLFALSSALCTLIGAITGTTPNPVPSGWTVTMNSDGTVTLTPPTPPPLAPPVPAPPGVVPDGS